jgi:GDP-D-mannose 3', 5'-epimerase
MKRALVYGAGGFIGSHMVGRLKQEGYWVRGVDLKLPEFSETKADSFMKLDLRNRESHQEAFYLENQVQFDEVYQLAADMGGAGYIFTGANDASVMHNSALINIFCIEKVADLMTAKGEAPRVFFSSSACIYPQEIQATAGEVDLKESAAYPANPDSEYGWEKLFGERLMFAFSRNYGIEVRVGRFHNIYGPEGTWTGGKEKAPAAICRKVAQAEPLGTVEIWGDGTQTRSFLYIDDCISAVMRFMSQDDFQGPLNIGSEEMVSINQLVEMTSDISGKKVVVQHVRGPIGVMGRNSNNQLIREKLGWDYEYSLKKGLEKTYAWIQDQVVNSVKN